MHKKAGILRKLFSLQRFGIKPGLERTLKLSEFIGNPHLKFPSIHVAGTNGKGSVCSLLASILMEAGYKVGLYTSPHLVNFNERIKMNGIEISDGEMIELAEELLIGEQKWGCTFFEITTIMAFEHFARNKVDIAIIETGMGGRFDSTNILKPILSIITSIDLDHKEYLGNTLEEIAFEKAGIIKEKTPVVIGKYEESVRNVFYEIAKSRMSQIFESNEYCRIENNLYYQDFSQSFDVISTNEKLINVQLPLAGKHQLDNIKQVISAINVIKDDFNITNENILNGFRNVKDNTGLIGRVDVFFFEDRSQKLEYRRQYNDRLILQTQDDLFEKHVPVVLDTGHNPEAIKRLVETLKLHRPDIEKWNFVFGAMEDKEINAILNQIESICNTLILTRPKIDRAISIDKLFKKAQNYHFVDIIEIEDVYEAVKYVIDLSNPSVLCGSFYLAGEALPVLEKMFKFHS